MFLPMSLEERFFSPSLQSIRLALITEPVSRRLFSSEMCHNSDNSPTMVFFDHGMEYITSDPHLTRIVYMYLYRLKGRLLI